VLQVAASPNRNGNVQAWRSSEPVPVGPGRQWQVRSNPPTTNRHGCPMWQRKRGGRCSGRQVQQVAGRQRAGGCRLPRMAWWHRVVAERRAGGQAAVRVVVRGEEREGEHNCPCVGHVVPKVTRTVQNQQNVWGVCGRSGVWKLRMAPEGNQVGLGNVVRVGGKQRVAGTNLG